ncbi:glycerophosphodiester phosphodiesterase [Patulibacter americanus]|uniref:glycerophosphodiester phosphodiesterase n=1 Tax=Patulibacter americanus TaxID=588672 RepID=UPI0003FB5C93|nr:glycerophosphodiester phosphodiesterase family protein [Patulibacter americanus]
MAPAQLTVAPQFAPAVVAAPPADRPAPRVIAHRGQSSLAPENTLAAIAAASSADLVEIDVDTSADGVPYVLHDATLDRTTDGTGALREHVSHHVDGLDAGSWFSPAFAGQRVPRLTAALRLSAARGARLLLEVKRPQTRAAVARYVAELREAGMLDRTVLQSFDEDTLIHARDLAPELRLALLRRTLDADPVAVARELGVVAYNPDWDALAPRPDVVGDLQAAGLAVVPWTVDDPAAWTTMRAAGVDGIITNRAGELARWNAAVATSSAAPTLVPDAGLGPAAVRVAAAA